MTKGDLSKTYHVKIQYTRGNILNRDLAMTKDGQYDSEGEMIQSVTIHL